MHCTAATTTTSDGPSTQEMDGTKTLGFKYRGYYQSSIRPGAKSSSSPSIDRDWAAVAKSTPSEFHHLYESIFRAVDALLRATTNTIESPRKSNSLLAMCLRKVPQFIEICEEEEREEAEKEGTMQLPSSSVSLGIYSDLETLGSEASGWKHLRVVVRQHGIDTLKSACAEGLLHETFVHLLVRLCTHLKAHDEAESLTSSLFDSYISTVPKGQYIYEAPSDLSVDLSGCSGPLASLGMLLQYAEETGRTSAALRQITELLSIGHLPASWLSSQPFVGLWHRVVRLLSSRGSPVCEEGVLLEFVATAIAKLVHSRPDDDISNISTRNISKSSNMTRDPLSASSSYHTIISILGSICAVGILQQEATFESGNFEPISSPAAIERLVAIVQRALSEVSRKIKVRKGQHKIEAAAHCYPRQYLLMLALCLLHSSQETHAENVESRDSSTFNDTAFQYLIESADSSQRGRLYDATVAFVTSVAENCGRGSEPTFSGMPVSQTYLLKLSAQAAVYLNSGSENSSSGVLTSRLQTDAAFLLASRTNDIHDLVFAESISRNSVQKEEHRLPPSSSPTSTCMGALSPLSSKTRPPPPTALFDGYLWEEGISEWVVSTPHAPSTRAAPKPKPARKSELVVIIDSMPPPESAVSDTKQRATRSGRLSLPTYFPTSSSSPRDKSDMDDAGSVFDHDSGNDTPPSPRTPGSQSELPSYSRPKRSRHFDAVSPAWESKPRLRTTRSLLNLVSDDEDENDQEDGDDNNEMEEAFDRRRETPRLPLSGHPSKAKNARRRSESTGITLKGRMVAVRRTSFQVANDGIDLASSDDELCL
ncbi:hypothetical protein Sste5346_000197 [Sporothrix stenoceras]|uniref:Wings apart-like protein C-terminal domain-containing protein n=1 Tax=Sporothrix stenoceras TaxID=5173 RepID=A0ABR3ZTZ8_9PEZI